MDRAFQRIRSLMLRGTFYSVPPNIMAEEEDHEQDLQDYLNDIARMKAYILKK